MNRPLHPPAHTADTAREWAAWYVQEMLSRGYTVEAAKAETHMGAGGPGQPGYAVSKGKITVEAFAFSFAELAKETTATATTIDQLELPL